ncbi:MAG: MiaB/RimO family radical SAM methylthiotransferase [Clostridia bacterium]|nr:MiaB/RimO family radical SAM methylthiotransferase [Clostridia bacterium]
MKITLTALGCKVNQYDAAAASHALAQAGQEIVTTQTADVAVVFTCSVTAEARRKSMQALRRAARGAQTVVAAGCVAQTEGAALLALPNVKLVLGSSRRAELPILLEQALANKICAVEPYEGLTTFEETPVIGSYAGRTRAHVKVQEGCDNDCAYCLVPQCRGPGRSRSLAAIADECCVLAGAGIKEIILTGIHLASYKPGLADAVEAAALSGVPRIRLGSLEADCIDNSVITKLAKIPQLCPHFYLPLQSASPTVTARMNRKSGAPEVTAAIAQLRNAFPGCAINTDVMVGFPGETEEEFQQTYDFCRAMAFARMHVFVYSPRPNTPAAAMPGRVDKKTAQARAKTLTELGETLRREYETGQAGTTAEVLWETTTAGHTRHGVEITGRGRVGEIEGILLPQ